MTVLAAERAVLPAPRPDLTWMQDAACTGMDVELFFPVSGPPSDEARAACRTCPVIVDCYRHIMTLERGYGEGARYGFFAGLTGPERWRRDPERRPSGGWRG